MIGEPELLGGVRDVPVVALQGRHDDLALGLHLLLFERAWGVGRGAWARPLVIADLCRHVVACQLLAVRSDDHALDDVAQLAHVVTVPVVGHQNLENLRAGPFGFDAEATARRREQVLDECRDVGEPLAQRRHAQRMHVEPEEEILAEPAFGHLLLQVTVRRRDHARVDRDRLGPADASDVSLLEHAQQLRLGGEGQVPDLIEKQRPAARRLERSLAGGRGARKRAAFVAEQLTLDELLGKGRAVHGDEWSLGRRPEAVQLARDELLAGAALAEDEHGTRDRRDAGDGLLQLGECGTRAHQRRVHAKPTTQRRHLIDEAPAFDGVLDLLPDPLHRLRLVDEADRAEADRLGAAVVVAGPCVHDDRDAQAEPLDGAQHLETVHPRHLEVQNHAVHRLGGERIERRPSCPGHECFVAAQPLQIVGVLLHHRGNVVNDQY